MPEDGARIIFLIKMPKSWTLEKKRAMYHKPHKQKPDKDNLEKGLLDAIYDEDEHIWDSRVTKVWAYDPKIIIIESGDKERDWPLNKILASIT